MSLPGESLSDAMTGGGAGEIMLFGVRVKVDPMRKSVSMNNLSEYDPVSNNTSNQSEKSGKELPKAAVECGGAVSSATGYASADDVVPLPSTGSGERKRGVPWTEEEHKLFLIGLQKVGKGDWRGISRNYVKTRTPTQVASHAQKYFLRRSNLNRRRRRSSLFDITTDSITAMPMEEGRNNSALNQRSSPMLVHQVPTSSKMADLNLNDEVPLDLSPLSLRLSLATGQDRSSSSRDSFQVSSIFKMVKVL